MVKKSPISTRYISLKKASEIFGYNPDYLGFLIRKGKIEGRRIGRDWFTSEESVKTYLSTKRFLPIKDILFSKVSPRIVFVVLAAAILIGIGAFLFFSPGPYLQRTAGDFTKKELQSKEVNIAAPRNKEVKEVKVTTYTSDSAGGIEVSIQPQMLPQTSKKESSLFQRIKNFFFWYLK